MPLSFHNAPIPFKGTQAHTLSNGLRVFLKEDHTIPVVAIQVWAQCGAVNEIPEINGLSHGLEHMVFKGTPTRNAGEITRAIESHGGAINAATQLETTHYYIDIPSYGASHALEVLADTVLNPTFPQDELERERLVILEEITRRNDSPDATLWDEFISSVFKNTPYEIKVIGQVETVRLMSQENLKRYYRSYYVPSNQVVVVVGDIDCPLMLEKVSALFSAQPAGSAPSAPQVNLEKVKPQHLFLKRPVQMSYVAVGKSTIGLGHKDSVCLDVLTDILGGGASSRLYQSLREEHQVAYSISCDYIPFKQKGLLAFFMETEPGRAEAARKRLDFEIKSILKKPITQEELNRARARIKSEWLHGSETPHGQASTLGSLAVLGSESLISSYLPAVESLTVDELMSAYQRYFDDSFFITQIDPE